MLFKLIRLSTSPYSKGAIAPLEHKILHDLKVKSHRIDYLGDRFKHSEIEGDPLILLTNSQTDVSRIAQNLLDQTALMIHPNSGYDNFTARFVQKANFPIVLGNTIRKQAVTEFILSHLFQYFCSIPKENRWNPTRLFERDLIAHKTILILGQGHIGTHLKNILSTLGAKVEIYDPYLGPKTLPKSKADVLIVALSLNETTKHIVNKKFLTKQMQERFCLINTARGEIVDESIIQLFPQCTFFLDVFAEEPKDFSHFGPLKNIVPTSHIAGVFSGLNQHMVQFEKEVITDFLLDINKFFQKYERDFLQNRLSKGKLL